MDIKAGPRGLAELLGGMPARLAALVALSPLLSAAAPVVAPLMLAGAEILRATRGEPIFMADAPAAHLHLLAEGRVALRASAEGGASTVLDILGPGEVFLAPAVVLDLPQMATAAAMSPCRILRLPAAGFRAALAADPGLARAAAEAVSRQWRRLAEQVVDLKLRDTARRVARYLADGLPTAAPSGPVDLPEPRTALAARLGMTPESLSRTLHAFADAGLLELSGRRVTVLDRAALLAAGPRGRAVEPLSGD
jgi:CRP-like cAMP-binding protein